MESHLSTNLKKYRNRNPIQRWLIKDFLRAVATEIKNLPAKNVLDAGCGEGLVIRYLKKIYPSLVFSGVDISEQAIKMAVNVDPAVSFKQGDIRQLDFGDNSFDIVLALEVLEHLDDPEAALKEISRVAKKYAIISVPWEPFFSWGNFIRGKNIKLFGRDPEHQQFWGKKEINLIVKRYFSEIKIRIVFPWILMVVKKNNHA